VERGEDGGIVVEPTKALAIHNKEGGARLNSLG